MSTVAGAAQDPESEYGQDQVKVFSHEGDGETHEHLNSMDLNDVKNELEKDAESAETPKTAAAVSSSAVASSSVTAHPIIQQAGMRPIHMVYTNGGAVPFMMPPFAAGTPLYPVAAPGIRPVKLEAGDIKTSQGQISIPTYGYPTAGFVHSLPVDQPGLRPAYPFVIPSQYVAAQMPYHQQLTTLGSPVAPNAAVQPNSGLITPQVKEKKPHIKKPLNAFMLFMKEKRAEVIKECTLKESAAINQILGKKWHALDRSEQAKYYEMAREERAKHMQMYPGWSARDNYAIHKKRKRKKPKQGTPEKEEDSGELGMPESKKPAPQESEAEDENERKCRARYGLEAQHRWCGPCRRKKKCVRNSEGDEEPGHSEGASPEGEECSHADEALPEGDDDTFTPVSQDMNFNASD